MISHEDFSHEGFYHDKYASLINQMTMVGRTFTTSNLQLKGLKYTESPPYYLVIH
jgi:hypothetical protein